MKPKLVAALVIGGLLIVAMLSLVAYWHGRRAGVVATQRVDIKHELKELDDEKEQVSHSVHALDTDSLRIHILDLSRRAHNEAAKVK